MHVYINITVTIKSVVFDLCVTNFRDRVFLWWLLLEMQTQAAHQGMPVHYTLLQQRKREFNKFINLSNTDTKPLTCFYSITVAASDASDKFASFSYFGECVNIIAPVQLHNEIILLQVLISSNYMHVSV